jgi:hypothetical protein
MRLTKTRIMEGDALYFRQLLLPMCDPKKSGIEDDPRLPYYSVVENWSSKYAAITGMTGSYGHAFKLPTIEELMHFGSAVIRNGVLGGLDGALLQHLMLTLQTVFIIPDGCSSREPSSCVTTRGLLREISPAMILHTSIV